MALTKVTGGILSQPIDLGITTATTGYFSGIVTAQSVRVLGDLKVDGSTTTLDTVVTEVDKLEVGADNVTVGVAITQSGTGDILRLYDSSTPVFVVKDGGRVGIGTDNPSAELDIEGEAARIHLHDFDHNQSQIIQQGDSLYLNVDSEGNGSGSLRIRVGGNDATAEKLRIGSNGNVGIKTNSPGADLHVYDGVPEIRLQDSDGIDQFSQWKQVGGNARLQLRNGNNNGSFIIQGFGGGTATDPFFRVSPDGSVGIGTDSIESGVKLHIQDTKHQIRLTHIGSGSTFTDAGVIFKTNDSQLGGVFTEVDGEILSYGINVHQLESGINTSRVGGIFRLDTRTGGFGNGSCFVVKGRSIGTTVEYNSVVINLNDGNTFLSPSKGSVGINSTTPTSKLDVVGDVKIVGVVTATTFKGVVQPTDLSVSGFSTFSSLVRANSGLVATGNIDLTGELNFNGNAHKFIDFETLDNNKRFDLRHRNASSHETAISCDAGGAVKLFNAGNQRLVTTNTGVSITDNLSVAGISTFTGAIDANGDLDVDGHTELDDVNVSGVITATSYVGGLPITNGADNRVITATSASAIQGESGLTFDGTTLTNSGSGFKEITIAPNTNNSATLRLQNNQKNFSVSNVTGGKFAIADGNTQRFVIDGSGNIGINTTVAQTTLEVVGAGVSVFNDTKTSAVELGFGRIELSRTDSVAYIDFKTSYSSEDFDCRIQQFGNGLRFYTGGQNSANERLRILSDGKVGIGTDTATAKLEITDAIGTTGEEVLLKLQGRATKNVYLDINADANRRGVIRFKSAGTDKWSIGRGDSDELSDDSFFIATGNSGGNTAKFVITSAGSVGIKSSTPNTKLDVIASYAGRNWTPSGSVVSMFERIGNSYITLVGGTTSVVGIDFADSTDNNRGFIHYDHNDDSMFFRTNAAEQLRITSSGNVGIGTSVADAQLNVYRNSSHIGHQIQITQDGTGDAVLGFELVGTRAWSMGIDNSDSDKFKIASGSAVANSADANTRLTIQTDGNIGIGTSNPQGQLHILGGNDGDCELIIEADPDNSNENDNPRILFRQDGGEDQSAVGTESNELVLYNSVSGGGIVFKTGTSVGYANATEKVRIASDGDVLIGGHTQGGSDSSKLSVFDSSSNIGIIQVHCGSEGTGDLAGIAFGQGGSSATARAKAAIAAVDSGSYGRTDLCFYVDGTADNNPVSAADEKLRITKSGNVGIGTDDPTTLLTLAKDANPTLTFLDYTNNAKSQILGSAGGQLVFQTDVGNVNANSDFIFRADSVSNEIVRFKDSGEVGIGTDNPTQKLEVKYGEAWIDNNSGDSIARSDGLTVSHLPNSDFAVASDPGDSKRAATFAVKGSSRAAIVTLRNIDDNAAFWDFIADGNTNKFYIQKGSNSGAALGPAVTIDTDLNVGIGTASPNAVLHVEKNGTSQVLARFESNMGTNNSRALSLTSPASDSGALPFTFSTGNSISFKCDNNVVHIDTDGKLGVGIDNPQHKLHIDGDIKNNEHAGIGSLTVAGVSTFNGAAVISAGAFPANLSAGGRNIASNIDIRSVSARTGIVVRNVYDYRTDSGSLGGFQVWDPYDSAATSYAFIAAEGATLVDKAWIKTNGTAYFAGLVSFAGDVSIGGTLTYEDVTNIDSVGLITARSGLHVTSGVSTFAGLLNCDGGFSSGLVQIGVSGIHRIDTSSGNLTVASSGGKIELNGLVGVGTNLPDEKLHVVIGSSTPVAAKFERSHNNNVAIEYRNTTGNMYAGLAGNALGWGIDNDSNIGSQPMFIVRRTTGYVGVGTVSPDAPLHILSDANNMVQIESTDRHSTLYLIDTIGSSFIQNDSGVLRFGTGGAASTAGGEDEALRITTTGDILTGGLTSRSFENDSSNQSILEVTGGGSGGNYGMINISGNSDSSNTPIGRINFINRENNNSTSTAVAGSKALGYIDVYTETSDSNAGDDSGGYMRFATKPESGGSAERMRITSDGGIVLKRASLAKIITDATDKAIYIAGGNDTIVGGNINLFGSTHASHANHLRFRSGSTVAMEIDENGKVGIGTITPLTSGAHSGTHQLTVADNAPSMSLGVSNTDQLYIRRELANGKFTFQTVQSGGNNGVISLQPYGGSVGIGTLDPQEKLHVHQDTGTATVLISSPTAPQIRINPNPADGSDNDRTIFGQATANSHFVSSAVAGDTVLRGKSTGNLLFGMGTSEKLRIESNGNLIAKSATQYKGFTLRKADGGTVAQLVGHGSDNDEGGLNLWDGGTKKVQILANGSSYLHGGNVGIGTNNAGTTLDVFGFLQVKDSTGKLSMQMDGANGNFKVFQSPPSWNHLDLNPMPILGWDFKSGPGDLMYMGSGGNTDTTTQMALVISDNHGFKVGRSGVSYDGTNYHFDVSPTAEWFRIANGGFVGIGTNAPQTKLHIRQDVDNNTDGFRISRTNSAASYSQYIDTSARFNIGYSNPSTADPAPQITLDQNGLVGIGSAIPAQKLDVAGNIKVDSGPVLENASSGDTLKITSPTGYVEVGSKNTSYSHFNTDRAKFYFNKRIVVNEGIVASYSQDLILATDITEERIRIKNDDGHVGIGTNNPLALLALYSDANDVALLHFDMGSPADRRGWRFKQSLTGTTTRLNLQAAANGKSFVVSAANDTEQFEVHTSSTAPFVRVQRKLHVDNDSSPSTEGGILVQNVLYASNQDFPYLIIGSQNYTGATTNWGTSGFQHRIKVDGSGVPRVTIDNNQGEIISFYSNRYVGIGVTNPVRPLHVQNSDCRIRLTDTGHATDVELSNASGDAVLTTNGASNLRLQTNNTERLRCTSGGSVNIGGDYSQTTYKMKVTGSFAATTKSFVIDHPTKEGMKLRYGSLEGPENGVYVRGRLKDINKIELPDYWTGLVDENTITVNLTPIGSESTLHKVVDIYDNTVIVNSEDGNINCFYTVFGERKDVEKMEVEY